MVAPERPSPDHYDDNIQVKPHFSNTPALTRIPVGHPYNQEGDSVTNTVKHMVSALYRKYGLKRCPHYGLFFAGSLIEVANRDRDRTMLLVIELHASDIQRWREIDADARKIPADCNLSGRHGVCVRYYKYRADSIEAYADDGLLLPLTDDESALLHSPATGSQASSQIHPFAATAFHRESQNQITTRLQNAGLSMIRERLAQRWARIIALREEQSAEIDYHQNLIISGGLGNR